MMKNIKYFALFFCFFWRLSSWAQNPKERIKVNPPANKQQFWLFLLSGQSNMAGRGKVEQIDTLPNIKVLTLNKDGDWEVAKDPIHFDRSYTGVGPGFTFGKEMLKTNDTIYIGLIPTAVGGSSINSWNPDSDTTKQNNYKKALDRTKLAMQSGVLKGVIWMQGETDCTEKGMVNYGGKLKNVVNGFRADFENENLPFIAAELPAFQMQQSDKLKQLQHNPYVSQINQLILGLKGELKSYDVISSAGTNHGGDHLHLDAKSARKMGKRYSVMMMKLLKK